jgi:hypothetical protein
MGGRSGARTMFSRLPFVVDEAILRFQVAGSNGDTRHISHHATDCARLDRVTNCSRRGLSQLSGVTPLKQPDESEEPTHAENHESMHLDQDREHVTEIQLHKRALLLAVNVRREARLDLLLGKLVEVGI